MYLIAVFPKNERNFLEKKTYEFFLIFYYIAELFLVQFQNFLPEQKKN